MSFSTKYLARIGIIASFYTVITIIFAPLSYGPVQIRISEALTVLPFVAPSAILGLFFGCVVANVYGGLGLADVIGGSVCTILAAIFTYLLSRTKKPILAPLPPVIINALGVSLYLHLLFNLPYLLTVIYIAVGEFLACYVLGYPLLKLILTNDKLLNLMRSK
ncbi:MAG: hypothetical protein AMJ90_09585 [candidate division Zixibacteria bacterium SM23_73_2]|nr:MAG: hypothetical protein AMJ90_09585 [candidate division Zixibacteria bacterium SM23_73_2]